MNFEGITVFKGTLIHKCLFARDREFGQENLGIEKNSDQCFRHSAPPWVFTSLVKRREQMVLRQQPACGLALKADSPCAQTKVSTKDFQNLSGPRG